MSVWANGDTPGFPERRTSLILRVSVGQPVEYNRFTCVVGEK